MWFSPSIRHVSRSKIHIYSCSQRILMTTITPTTSIKSSISFYSKSIKVFQNTDLRFNKSYLLTSWGKGEIWCKRNINLQQHKNSHSNIFISDKFTFLSLARKRGGIDVVFSLFPLLHMKLQFVLWTEVYCLVTMTG